MSDSLKDMLADLQSAERYDDMGYMATKDINVRLIWLRAALADYTIPVMPPHLQVCSSYKCNYQCRFCGGHGVSDSEHKRLNSKVVMSGERLDAIMAEMWPYAYTWSLASSGEFFCQPNIAEVLRASRQYESRASITTNGSAWNVNSLSELIPNMTSIRVSMVSLIEEAYEFFHRHGNFKRVVNNIRTLVRARQLVYPTRKSATSIMGPILNSTMRELCHRVRVAHGLGVESVGSTSFLLQTDILKRSDPRWGNESGEDFPELWNACRRDAGKLLSDFDMIDQLHRPFDGVDAGYDRLPDDNGLMFPRIMDYVESAPPIESYFDAEKIESDAQEINSRIADGEPDSSNTPEGIQSREESVALLKSVLTRNADKILQDDDSTCRICFRFDLNGNVLPGAEWRPCCISKKRFPIKKDATISSIYNSNAMRTFAEALCHGEIPEECMGCRDLIVIKRSDLVREALAPGLLNPSKEIYDRATKHVTK